MSYRLRYNYFLKMIIMTQANFPRECHIHQRHNNYYGCLEVESNCREVTKE